MQLCSFVFAFSEQINNVRELKLGSFSINKKCIIILECFKPNQRWWGWEFFFLIWSADMEWVCVKLSLCFIYVDKCVCVLRIFIAFLLLTIRPQKYNCVVIAL